MELLITYHRNIVEGLLLVTVLNLFLPWAFSKNIVRMIFWTRIGFFAFWALWAMTLFTGLIVFVFMKQKLTIPVDIMIAAGVLLPFLDGYRAVKLRKIWQKELTGLKFNAIVTVIEILVIVAVTLMAIQK